MKILYLEDNDMVAMAFKHLVRHLRQDAEMIRANNLSEARKILNAGTNFHAAILDYNLPDGVGTDLISRLRKEQPDCKIIVCSSVIGLEPDSEQEIRDSAPDFMLGKPFKIEEIKKILNDPGLLA